MDMIRAFAGQVPVFGVCLGHQSIVEVFGGKVVRARRGSCTARPRRSRTMARACSPACRPATEVGRYHSLIAKPDTLPAELEVTARTPEGEIMGVRHRTLKVEGVQFHPESVLTPDGPALIGNFLKMTRRPAMNLRDTLEHLLSGKSLSEAEAGDLLRAITVQREMPPALAGALLAASALQGRDAPMRCAVSRAPCARWRASPQIPHGPRAIDIVGTGGDASGSFNLSTGAALLTAACGVDVVKHGNRSVSSKSGSADVLEQLGLKLPLDESAAGACLAATRFTFLFAPHYHPAMKAVAPIRQAMGVRTVFNILGPADQSRGAAVPAHGRVQPAHGAAHGRSHCPACPSSAPSWSTAPKAGTSPRRSGRSPCSTCVPAR